MRTFVGSGWCRVVLRRLAGVNAVAASWATWRRSRPPLDPAAGISNDNVRPAAADYARRSRLAVDSRPRQAPVLVGLQRRSGEPQPAFTQRRHRMSLLQQSPLHGAIRPWCHSSIITGHRPDDHRFWDDEPMSDPGAQPAVPQPPPVPRQMSSAVPRRAHPPGLRGPPAAGLTARRTHEPLRPPQTLHIRQTRRVVGKPLQQLLKCPGIVDAADGVGRSWL